MKRSLNLLPARVVRRQLLVTRLRQWAFVWLGAGLVSAGIIMERTAVLMERMQELQHAEQEAQPLHAMEAELVKTNDRLHELEQTTSPLGLVRFVDQPLQLLGILGRSSEQRPSSVQVLELQLVVENTQEPPAAKAVSATTSATPTAAATPVHKSSQLRLQGTGIDNLAVAQFVAGLRDSGVFDRVALLSTIHADKHGPDAKEFQIECTFR